VVIAIMAVVLALVAPLTVERIDKLKARSEIAQLRRALSELSVRAYASHQPLELQADGSALRWTGARTGQLVFEHLFFTPQQSIAINSNGIARPAELTVTSRNIEQRLPLNGWLEAVK
jgi:type II secretory pathway pseudopilin PulG